MNKEVFAPFEMQHGFDSDRFLRNEESRLGEFEIKHPSSSQEDRLLRSKTQWEQCGRVVMDGAQAMKTVVSRSGHNLRLYSEAQTKQI